MTRRILACLCVIVGVLSTACGTTDSPRAGEIVVTTNILGDVVRNIVGDAATVRVLMQPNADPHSFGVSARDAAVMEGAGLIVYNGLGLEKNILRNVESAAAEGVPTLSVGERIDPLQYATGDDAGNPDPHFWTDPQRMIIAVDAIEEAVREVAGIDGGEVSGTRSPTGRSYVSSTPRWATASTAFPPIDASW